MIKKINPVAYIISVLFYFQKSVEDEKVTEEIIKTDVSKLSKRQKLQILEKESPELFSLIDDYKSTVISI